MQWLIQELKKYKGTLLVISHDRYFINSTINKIIQIDEGKVGIYYGNYSFYREERKRRYEARLNEYRIQESNKAKTHEEITRLKNWSDKAHRDSTKKQAVGLGKKEYFRKKGKKKDKQIKSKIKKLEKLELEGIKKPKEDKKINFSFNEDILKGKRIIETVDIEKSFDSKVLFKDSSFYIMRGEKVGIFGANGCGKTTLLKILLGEENLDKGGVYVSKSISIGYLSQQVVDFNKNKSIIELFDIDYKDEESRIRTFLANMGFNENMINQPLYTLSHGELIRVRMTKLISKSQDLLVLDEPLNHLDIYSREKLEESLKDYNGTVILVSHDRYMIENICSGLLVFENNKIKKIIESPKEYFEKPSNTSKDTMKQKKRKNNTKQIKENVN